MSANRARPRTENSRRQQREAAARARVSNDPILDALHETTLATRQQIQQQQQQLQTGASLAQAHADLEVLWQRVVSTARAVSAHLQPMDGDEQRLPGVADPSAYSSDAEDTGRLRQVDGWTFVDRGAANSAGRPTAAPRRRVRELTPAEGLPVLRAPVPPRITRETIQLDSLVPPVAQGPVTLFGDDDDSGSDDDDIMEGPRTLVFDAPYIGGGERIGLLTQPLHGDTGDLFERLTAHRRHTATRSRRRAGLSTSPRVKRSDVRASVIVCQPWNSVRQWRPYVYDPPMLRGDLNEAAGQPKPLANAEVLARQYAVHSGIGELALDCTNADDMGRGSLSNMFRLNSSLFITSRPRNVHLELTLGGPRARHHVVERIYVMSSMTNPPCTELMVFASSRRCNFSELRKYDDFTFAQYEQLAAADRPSLDEPLPIAYFWLNFEEEYEQLQTLPEGVCCRYLYFKLLRSPDENFNMSMRLIRVFGWEGPRSFAGAVIC
ncbi:hypothetical protein H4R19_003960 [Coemansia spiralis]|nr:hypothetical protein H4R19_003960 [Coemansia spiralis]